MAVDDLNLFRCWALASCVAALGLGCGGGNDKGTQPPASVAPPETGSAGSGAPPVGTSGGVIRDTTAGCPVPIFQQCKTCHDGRGTAGTPMGLMTYEDFMAPSHTNPALPVYQMVKTRVHDTVKPMPPTGQLAAGDLGAIDTWIAAGARDCGFARTSQGGAAGTGGNIGASGSGVGPGVTHPTGMAGTSGSAGTGSAVDVSQYLSPDGSYFIKEPPGNLPVGPDAPDAEFCFNIVAHNDQTPLAMDPTPFEVAASEFYHEFYFQVPYTKTLVGLTSKPIIQNPKVLHHWLLFHVQSDTGVDGSHADEIGLQVGNELLSGWAPGGNPPDMPPGVGEEMPPPGGFIALEFHYFNNTGAVAEDRSGVRICGTSTIPPNIATLTWLGTETINIPAGQTGTATGTCTPGVQTGDIHLVFASPHMHKLGSHMTTVINRMGGGNETVVDMPFMFTDQRQYSVMNIIHPGDTLTTTCTWQNTTPGSVGFGTSTTDEMCYDFVLAYPAHSLPNPLGGGIEGSSNMCLQ